jgi:hypothetical protein
MPVLLMVGDEADADPSVMLLGCGAEDDDVDDEIGAEVTVSRVSPAVLVEVATLSAASPVATLVDDDVCVSVDVAVTTCSFAFVIALVLMLVLVLVFLGDMCGDGGGDAGAVSAASAGMGVGTGAGEEEGRGTVYAGPRAGLLGAGAGTGTGVVVVVDAEVDVAGAGADVTGVVLSAAEGLETPSAAAAAAVVEAG